MRWRSSRRDSLHGTTKRPVPPPPSSQPPTAEKPLPPGPRCTAITALGKRCRVTGGHHRIGAPLLRRLPYRNPSLRAVWAGPNRTAAAASASSLGTDVRIALMRGCLDRVICVVRSDTLRTHARLAPGWTQNRFSRSLSCVDPVVSSQVVSCGTVSVSPFFARAEPSRSPACQNTFSTVSTVYPM